MEMSELLLRLAEKSGLYKGAVHTTKQLALATGMAQQSISRNLILLEAEGLIERRADTRGTWLKLTEKGRLYLQGLHERLRPLFRRPAGLKGRVFSGLMEGRFYVAQAGYQRQFQHLLGFRPFAGTLNLRVDPSERSMFLAAREPLHIRGFKAQGRGFGELLAYPVNVARNRAAVVVPERSHYKEDTLELISRANLRQALGIKDGDEVTVT